MEYGNVGTDFKCVPREGFGWMNASYQVGLSYLNTQMRRALGTCTIPDLLFEKAIIREQRMLGATPEEEEITLRRRRTSTLAALAITQNGSIDAAVTRISLEPHTPKH